MEINKIYLGDCLDILKTLPDNSIDSVVCAPPYGLDNEPEYFEIAEARIEYAKNNNEKIEIPFDK